MMSGFIMHIVLKIKGWCSLNMRIHLPCFVFLVLMVFAPNAFGRDVGDVARTMGLRVGVFSFVDSGRLSPDLFKKLVMKLRTESEDYYDGSIDILEIKLSRKEFFENHDRIGFEYLKSFIKDKDLDVVLFVEDSVEEQTYIFSSYNKEGYKEFYGLPMNRRFDSSLSEISTGVFLSMISSVCSDINKLRVY